MKEKPLEAEAMPSWSPCVADTQAITIIFPNLNVLGKHYHTLALIGFSVKSFSTASHSSFFACGQINWSTFLSPGINLRCQSVCEIVIAKEKPNTPHIWKWKRRNRTCSVMSVQAESSV